MKTFEDLEREHAWAPLRGCPGRYILRGGPSPIAPRDLLGEGAELRECRSPLAADPVIVARTEWGGLISYRKADGRYIHTLNTVEGFERKCRQLGIGAVALPSRREPLLGTGPGPEKA